jgi:hypothetical protein
MAVPGNFPFGDVVLSEGTTSIATTPVAASMVAPCNGILRKVYAASAGTTTGTIAVSVTVNGGSDVTGGGLTIAAGAGGNNPGLDLSKVGANVVNVNEGDLITFTPSGGTGSSIAGAFAAVIRPQ